MKNKVCEALTLNDHTYDNYSNSIGLPMAPPTYVRTDTFLSYNIFPLFYETREKSILSHKCSQPVSKYKDSFDAKIGMPVTMLAAFSCTFSNSSVSEIEQPSDTLSIF